MSQYILEMKNITKRFPGVLALNDVTFDAREGEILALVGENGAGKSTLMKILSGAYPDQSYDGDIYINGSKKVFRNPRDSEAAGIAMIYQEISMHLDMSVAENIFLGNWSKKYANVVDWNSMNNEAKKYLDMIELDVEPEEILRNLSTSRMQMVSIARALAREPKILVLDEPTSALTKTESEILFHTIHQLKEKGITSILISHKLDEVFENADRITVLRDGNVISTNERENATREKVVSDMVGREITTFYPKEEVEIGDVVMRVENYTVPHPYNSLKNIVEDASFELKHGEVLGIAGLVGAGRSELVNAIFGRDKKVNGRVFIDGEEVNIKSPEKAIENGISLVTEDRKHDGLVEVLSIKENSTMSILERISNYGVINAQKEKKKAKEYFNKLNIKAGGIETIVQTLSGGNQQKVVLSKCLMVEPKILILDEPTRGVDVGTKHEIYKIMMELVKDGISIIMISSELPELLSMSDRIIVLAGGKIRGEFNASECTYEQIMQLATQSS